MRYFDRRDQGGGKRPLRIILGTAKLNYAEVLACFEKEHPDRLRALIRRHINALADY